MEIITWRNFQQAEALGLNSLILHACPPFAIRPKHSNLGWSGVVTRFSGHWRWIARIAANGDKETGSVTKADVESHPGRLRQCSLALLLARADHMFFPCLTTRLSCCCSCEFWSGIVWSVCSVLRAELSATVSALGGPGRAQWWPREAQGGAKGRALGGPGRVLAVPRTAQGGQCFYFVPPAVSPLTRFFTNCRIFFQSVMQNHFFKVNTIAFNDLWNISWYNL